MGHYRQIPGGDTELEQRYAELTQLRAQHAEARGKLHQLRQEIDDFVLFYDWTLGRRLADLETLEKKIDQYSGSSNGEGCRTQKAAEGAEPAAWKSDVRDLKSLYREVAKAIHPDTAGAGPAKLNRHELMSKANQAYAEADQGTLQEILRDWWQSRPEWDPVWAELVTVESRIAQERRDVDGVNARIEALTSSRAYQFKLRLDTGTGGSHLLADMMTAVDLNIDRAAARLAALRKRHEEPSPKNTERGVKALRFPVESSCGTVYLRDRRSLNYTKWMKAGPARGVVRVDAGIGARLDITASEGSRLEFLSLLKPDDLQSLYLMEACDSHMDDVVHLTGLEELYLSGEGITDAALVLLSRLSSLKRLYIYKTGISDHGLRHLRRLPALCGLTSSGNRITEEGLEGFRRAQPHVNTVSFLWNR